jgi:hypothetical protein
LGYAALYKSRIKATPVPSWMPNQGVLQTSWTVTSENGDTTATINLDIFNWILDLVKPVGDQNNEWSLIGVQTGAQAPRLFKFILYDETDQTFGKSTDILRVGGVSVTVNEDVPNCSIEYLSVI